jgi:hypothetical protein
MLAPVDAVATVTAEGQSITLRLNMRTMALAAAGGVDLFDPAALDALTTLQQSRLVHALASIDTPDLTEDHALALVVRHGEATGAAIIDLLARAAGGNTANPPKAGRKQPKGRATAS